MAPAWQEKMQRAAQKSRKNPGFEPVKLQLWLANCILVCMLQRTLPAGFVWPCLPIKNLKTAANSCTRSSTTVFGLLPAKIGNADDSRLLLGG
jgi:hypothetical protein